MTRVHSIRLCRLQLAACAVLFAMAGADEPAVSPRFFLVDGMAVDPLETPEEEGVRFEGGLPSLAAGGPGPTRRRLLDPPEASRDPGVHRELAAHLERADRLARRGQVQAALLELRDGLALDPVSPVLLSRAAVFAASVRDHERAAGYYRRFFEVQSEDSAHAAGFAAVLLRLARFDEAEAMLARTGPDQKENLVVRFTRLCIELLQGNPDPSPAFWRTRSIDQVMLLAGWLRTDGQALRRLIGVEEYRELCDITLGEGTAERLEAIGVEMERLRRASEDGDAAALLLTFDELRRMGVESLGIESARAEMLFREGQAEAALATWKGLLDRQADWIDAWFNYGFTLFRMDRYDEAVAALRRAHELGQPPMLRFVLASALALSGAHDEPRDLFVELTRSHPDEVRQWLGMDARFHQAVRRMDNSQNLFRRIGIPPEIE